MVYGRAAADMHSAKRINNALMIALLLILNSAFCRGLSVSVF